MINTIAMFLVGWFAVAVGVGLVVGRAIYWAQYDGSEEWHGAGSALTLI